jgi:hypothetical protein
MILYIYIHMHTSLINTLDCTLQIYRFRFVLMSTFTLSFLFTCLYSLTHFDLETHIITHIYIHTLAYAFSFIIFLTYTHSYSHSIYTVSHTYIYITYIYINTLTHTNIPHSNTYYLLYLHIHLHKHTSFKHILSLIFTYTLT